MVSVILELHTIHLLSVPNFRMDTDDDVRSAFSLDRRFNGRRKLAEIHLLGGRGTGTPPGRCSGIRDAWFFKCGPDAIVRRNDRQHGHNASDNRY